MRVFALVVALVFMVGCKDKDIDGVLQVFADFFVLMDEDGERIRIQAGVHEAEFSYDNSDSEVELEIENVVGDDEREFEFSIPNPDEGVISTDGVEERLDWRVSASETGQTVDLDIAIRNTVLSKKEPTIFWDRCGAYYGIWGGLAGVVKNRNKRERGHARSSSSGISEHIYTVSSPTKSRVDVAIKFVVGREVVALFEGSENQKYRDLIWEGECGDYRRPVLERRD